MGNSNSNNIPSYNNKSNNYKYNYHPSSYNSLLGKRELDTNTRKILEKYKHDNDIINDDYKKKLTYDYFKNCSNPCYNNNNYPTFNKYKYNQPEKNYLLNNDCSNRNEIYQRPTNCNYTYTYSIQSLKNRNDYNSKNNCPDNLLKNTKYENCYMPNSQSNYNYNNNNNFTYQKYFKNERIADLNNKMENNIKNNDIKKGNNIIPINKELSYSKMNNNINNNNINIIRENNKKPQAIPKNNSDNFNNLSNNNYNNNMSNYNQNKRDDGIMKKTEVITNRSPSDIYYNTLHEDYLPKKEDNQFNYNPRIYRTYEIDTSKYGENKNSLFSHSLIMNDLKEKNRNYY